MSSVLLFISRSFSTVFNEIKRFVLKRSVSPLSNMQFLAVISYNDYSTFLRINRYVHLDNPFEMHTKQDINVTNTKAMEIGSQIRL